MAGRKLLFVDRDGTLLVEPADFQIDALHKFQLVPDVIVPLKRLVDAGYALVMVSNQDGLGTDSFPEADFWPPQQLLLDLFASQGLHFLEIHIDRHFAHEPSSTRKPQVGMVLHWLRDTDWDRAASAMVGDRPTDLEFAANLGIRGFQLAPGPWTWPAIARELLDAPRVAEVTRNTKETRIQVRVDLDAEGPQRIHTGLGFFDHMLEQIGRHAGIALDLQCVGDLQIDEHHTVEDCALALGQCLRQALGDKRGIGRYGFVLPMDETRAEAALDLSGRPYCVFEGQFAREAVGQLPSELVPHFFRSLCETLGANLHLTVRGDNTHHMIEACFKVFARALRPALARVGHELPSTKGVL